MVNIDPHVTGDYFDGLECTLYNVDENGDKTVIDLTDATASLTFRDINNKSYTLTTAGGELLVSDATGGKIQIVPQAISFTPSKYEGFLNVTLGSGITRIYVKFIWSILRNA